MNTFLKLSLVVIVLGLVGCNKSEPKIELSLEDKLMELSFSKEEDMFKREVTQGSDVYQEIITPTENNFIRILDLDIEKDVFVYNYIDNTFTYLYYIDGELTSKLVYSYSEDTLDDKDDLWELIKNEAGSIKEYFLNMINEKNIEIGEL